MSVRIDHAVSSGTFSLDGETFDVDNNIWVVGDDDECIVIDAPHDVDDILAVVAGRKVKAIVCTHAHDDHVRVAPELRERVERADPAAPRRQAGVGADPHRPPLGRRPRGRPDVKVGGAALKVIHTPGHAPGAVCLYVHDLGCVFTGDTLFEGGPGATGRSFSDEDQIKESIRSRLFDLPDETVVHTGHGADTTIGAERANLA